MNLNNVVEAAEHLTGFVIVMLALLVLWGVTAQVGRLFSGRDRAPAAKAPPAAASPAVAATEPKEDLDDELIVVAAAAAALLGAAHRVVAIRPLPSFWGAQGKRDIHSSRRLR